MNSFPLFLIPLLPLLGAFLNGFLALYAAGTKKTIPEKWVSLIGVLFPALSFLLVVQVSFPYLFQNVSQERLESLGTWFSVGSFTAEWLFRIDRLSVVMALLVTGVGTLIHLFSVGYMKEEKGFARYFSFLNLFLAFMLTLVLAGDLVLLFLGWEGVGLCSYLLIGFWFKDLENAKAAKKAFLVNRVGDFCFLIAFFWIISLLSHSSSPFSLSFDFLNSSSATLAVAAFPLSLLLFAAASGKSAQLPLHVWLPDAMAGPTPVSALIHAATMVTAGIYLLIRFSFLIDLAPLAKQFLPYLGGATAIFGATVALVQTDLKKVLAYSTISQLGLLFLAVGIGAHTAALFHLLMHGFFKACLFLGAGAVIHLLGGEQDIRQMGGLRKKVPSVFWTFLFAGLALSGFPPFSGFFSKDEILWQAYSQKLFVLWGIGLATSFLTAFYTFRLIQKVFLGSSSHQIRHSVSFSMKLPLLLLAMLSLGGGWIGISRAFGAVPFFENWIRLEDAPVLLGSLIQRIDQERIAAAISTGVASLGFLLSFVLYRKKAGITERWADRFSALHQFLQKKYYFDELYEKVFGRALRFFSEKFLARGVDHWLVDQFLVSTPSVAPSFIGNYLTKLQTGRVNDYSFYFLVGLVGIFLCQIFFLS